MDANQEKFILGELRKRSRKVSQKCYAPGCDNNSIRSHIHQKKGPLSIIAENGRIVQLQITTYFSELRYRFNEESIAVGDVLTFYGFCPSCDSKLFDEIENNKANFYDYRHQLLFSYRGFLSELYKQQYNLKWYELIEKHSSLSEDVKALHKPLIEMFTLIVQHNIKVKRKFEQDLFEGGDDSFEFVVHKLPKIQLCTSTCFAFPVQLQMSREDFIKLPPEIIPMYFVNLIPTEESMYFIMGKLKSNNQEIINFEDLKTSNSEMILKFISDMLIKHIETWCLSISAFKELKDKKVDNKILELIQAYLPAAKKFEEVNFNIFNYMDY